MSFVTTEYMYNRNDKPRLVLVRQSTTSIVINTEYLSIYGVCIYINYFFLYDATNAYYLTSCHAVSLLVIIITIIVYTRPTREPSSEIALQQRIVPRMH